MLIIRTKEQLKQAKDNKIKNFVVVGELAKQLHKVQKISKLSVLAVGALAATYTISKLNIPGSKAAAVGINYLEQESTSKTSKASVSLAIAAISCGGIVLVYALYKEYNITVKANTNGEIELEFNRK